MEISYDAKRPTFVRLLIWFATSRLARWLAEWNYRVETALCQESAGWDPVTFDDVRPWGPARRTAFGVIEATRPPSTLTGTKRPARSEG